MNNAEMNEAELRKQVEAEIVAWLRTVLPLPVRHTYDDLADAEMHAIAEAATPGPWCFEAGVEDCEGEFYVCHADTICDATTVCNPLTEANARHIATFDPPTVLALLDERDELKLALAEADRKNNAINAEWNDALGRLAKAEARVVGLREGEPVIYVMPEDRSIYEPARPFRATFIQYVEGWCEIRFVADDSTAIVRPSRVTALATPDVGEA